MLLEYSLKLVRLSVFLTKQNWQSMLGFIGDRINLVNLNLKIRLWLNEGIAISAII